ncbi:MAG: YhcH/YjgK/YiaL family protein [Prevotella sp.]|jgi:YhcH/YjgK/YiaL family protein|nr:YhcH/YjgK/YiaL family protein [Prevotella sp.]
MIIDTIDNLAKYEAVNPLFKDVVAFIKEHDLSSMEAGKHTIKGSDLFVNIAIAKGRTPDAAVLETHRNMIDIQIPIDNAETYGYTPLCRLPDEEYNAEKDITKYPDLMAESFIDCQPGMFAIFFPQDGHAPCISMAPEIKKAIFKVKA